MNIPSISMKKTLTAASITLCVAATGFGEPEATDTSSPKRWSVKAGPLFRDFDGGSFQTGSRSSTVALPGGSTFYRLSTGAAGPESGEALREYSDGFVGPDTAGTTPGSFFTDTTSRFGFENDSQNNADTTIVFQGPLTGEQGLTSSGSSGSDLSWEDDPGSETGAIVELGLQLSSPERAVTVSGVFAFLYSPFEINGGGSTFEASRTDTRREISGTVTDTYTVPTGVILPLAPYSQPSADPIPGFYPRIADEPTRVIAPEVNPSSTNSFTWFNRIEESVDADVFTFSLGPEVQVSVADVGFLALSAGAALHLVDWDATHEETLYRNHQGASESVQRWKDQTSGTDVVWGGFAQVSGGLALDSEDASTGIVLQAFARWDVTEDLDGTVGPSTFTLDLDAFSAGAMAGFLF
jgi:hypothetical protein